LLDNLLTNAFVHGGGDEPVEVDARRDGDAVVVAVRDRGPGPGPDAAMRVGVDREWHPTRPDPVVAAAGAPPRLEAALEAGHRTLLRIGPVTLSPTTRATPEGAGCRAAIEARVVLRAIRTADGGVRFESVRRLTLAEAPDEDALRAWAADPGRVEDALRRLGDRIADDVRWLL
ncbi:MAG TPA: ATP-binding protein, partial [Burkholderiaceae bacterium]|nr:ATP-binding protein [Burkholderiaceae bacterium]